MAPGAFWRDLALSTSRKTIQVSPRYGCWMLYGPGSGGVSGCPPLVLVESAPFAVRFE
jgi:hypothetical protein